MKPRYSDGRYKTPYVPSVETNLKKTFARAIAAEKAKRKAAEAIEAEQAEKVQPMTRAK